MEGFNFSEFEPKGHSDQHFLTNKEIARRQVGYAGIGKNDIVLEIGAGLGNITKEILRKNPSKVRIIEKDKELVNILINRFKDKKIELIKGNALEKDFGNFNKSISNIPYSISSDLTFKLLKHQFDLAIWMYQKEFAERLVAKAGTKEYGRLTVGVRYFADVELLCTIPRNFFKPQPKVDSALVEIKPKEEKKQLVDQKLFFDLTRAIFTQRRKKLKNALENTIHMIPQLNEQTLEKSKSEINEYLEKRPEDIEPKELGIISNKIKKVIN